MHSFIFFILFFLNFISEYSNLLKKITFLEYSFSRLEGFKAWNMLHYHSNQPRCISLIIKSHEKSYSHVSLSMKTILRVLSLSKWLSTRYMCVD